MKLSVLSQAFAVVVVAIISSWVWAIPLAAFVGYQVVLVRRTSRRLESDE